MDTCIDDAIYVYGKDDKYLRFAKTSKGLYCMELHDEEEKETCFFATIKGKMAMFLELDQKQAKAVRELQERLGFPSDIDLAKAIDYNTLGTCQFNRRDIRIANLIFGPCRAAIEGKSTQRKNKMDQQDKCWKMYLLK